MKIIGNIQAQGITSNVVMSFYLADLLFGLLKMMKI